ncbi:MAG: hypothetical protein Q9227_005951 [Pyrenula ochraceoflavens]
MWSRGFRTTAPLLAGLVYASRVQASANCTRSVFKSLTLDGIHVLNLDVTASTNFSSPNTYSLPNGPTGLESIAICQVTVTYTHPGQNDTVNAYIGLPLSATDWNSRFLMLGGGGWVSGDVSQLVIPVLTGYASASTDGGHDSATVTADWALVNGRVNWPTFVDYSSRSLDEAATLGKLATRTYFGSGIKHSYFNGCSTGGRQGLTFAQKYPNQFDGIVAAAPAIYWERLLTAMFWPYVASNIAGVIPPQCITDAITDAAFAACDGLDGVLDNIISLPGQCHFDPRSTVGQGVTCSELGDAVINITRADAELTELLYQGATTPNGTFLWYGRNPGQDLSALINNTCTSLDPSSCSHTAFSVAADWIQDFIVKNPSYDYTNVGHATFARLFAQSVHEYIASIGTESPDLAAFKARGGKMISWHGLQDQAIFPNQTVHYYNEVTAADPAVRDYYRLFLAPGVLHCGTGPGFDPTNSVLGAVEAWVEKGTAPKGLQGTATAVGESTTATRIADLCAYPEVMSYIGGNPNEASSFACR